MTKPMTPRVLRINLLETRVRSTLADVDALLDEADAVLADAACGGAHAIQQCPEIRAALFAPACPTCADDGYIEAGGWGDQAGGYAQTCPDCGGLPPAPIGAAPGPAPLQPIAADALLVEADAVLAA